MGRAILLGMLQVIGEAFILGRGLDAVTSERWAALYGLSLLLLWPALALAVKREHDRDGSGWKASLVLVAMTGLSFLRDLFVVWDEDPGPVVTMKIALDLGSNALLLAGLVYLIVMLGFLDGTPGPNRFGPSPKRFDPPLD